MAIFEMGYWECIVWKLSLHLLFGKNLEKATRIIDKRGVKKISGLPSGRSIFQVFFTQSTLTRCLRTLVYLFVCVVLQVVGESQKREEYLCFPGDYCGCYSFFYDVVSRGEQQCVRFLIIRVLNFSTATDFFRLIAFGKV